MSRIGKRAVVIGAGVGGIAAAGALIGRFDEVVVLERDQLPDTPQQRLGAQQGRHVHALLTAGQRALEELLPGFTDAMVAGGAVPTRANSDSRVEMPGYDPFPRRDFGWYTYCVSRPLLEFTGRKQAEGRGVEFRSRARAKSLETSADGARVTGVRYETDDGDSHLLEADLVIDASGRAVPTLELLKTLGRPAPEETTIGVDFAYATAVFETPADPGVDWKILMTMPGPTDKARGGLLCPMEGGRWIVSLGGRGEDKPPEDLDGFLDYARGLRTQTLYDLIKDLPPVFDIARYGFPASFRRHFDRMAPLPRGLLPLGDSISRFNPVYGQGMTVASLEALKLAGLLDARAGDADPLAGLGEAYFAEIEPVIDAAWSMSAIPDLAQPTTTGERPPNLAATLQLGLAFLVLSARDPEVHKLDTEVRQLMKLPSALADPALVAKVMAVMAEMQAAQPA